MHIPREKRTGEATLTFQQLPQLFLLLGNFIQEELGVEMAYLGRGQAAPCAVLGPKRNMVAYYKPKNRGCFGLLRAAENICTSLSCLQLSYLVLS